MALGIGASRGKGGPPAPRPSPTPMGRIMFLLCGWVSETQLLFVPWVWVSVSGYARGIPPMAAVILREKGKLVSCAVDLPLIKFKL